MKDTTKYDCSIYLSKSYMSHQMIAIFSAPIFSAPNDSDIPELKIRPSYEDGLRDNEAENELIQIDAMMIQPSTTESCTVEAIPINIFPDHSRLSLVTRVSRHIDNFLRKQGASDLQMPTLMPEYHTKLVVQSH